MLPRSVSENVTFLRAGISNGYRVVDAESQEFDSWDSRKYFLNNLTGIIEDGYVVRAWGTQRDVTEQRRAEEALRQSEELYRTVVEQAAENIFIVDVETKRILEINDASRNSLGYEDEEIERMTLYDIVEADRESVDQNIQHILEKGHHPVGEHQYRRRDGSKVDVEVSVSLVFMGGRQTMCVVARDITERKWAEEALQEVREAERNRIARDLHDDILQNIVYALQETSILQAISEDGGAPELEEIADALRCSVEGLREAIFELRLEETIKQSFVVSLRSLIELSRRMSRKRYSLDLEVEGEFLEDIPHGVSREIMRILQEALNNARRHANPQHVWVRLGVEADELWVEVEDDGGGFDLETFVGGVGQHSMRQRAAKLGGRLRVESEPGSGTRMSFRVPYSRLIEE